MSKGKCYSKVNRGQRKKSDFYPTPYLLTQSLFDNEYFDDSASMIEPACGEMAMVDIIKKNFKGNLTFYDIKFGNDFLKETRFFDYMITNPPFSLANEFILHAKKIINFKFYLLLPLNYLQGQFRYENIYQDHNNFPLSKIYIFSKMPMLSGNIRKDGKYKTGMQALAWYVWEKRPTNYGYKQPCIYWIDSKNHIYRRK